MPLKLRGNISDMTFSDTSPAAQQLQEQIQRSMSGSRRILLSLEMSLFARELARARICMDHPEWDDQQVARELVRIAFLPAPLPANFR
jgi:hypothetical protein